MANLKVALRIRIRNSAGKRCYAKIASSVNGRLKPLYAEVGGKAEYHAEGVYHIRYKRNGRRVWEEVGTDPNVALAAKLRREKTLEALALGIEVKGEAEAEQRVKIAVAAAQYLADNKAQKAPKTFLSRTRTLRYFSESCTKVYLDQIERRDLLDFTNFLIEEKELGPRTVYNLVAGVNAFLRYNGIMKILGKDDWPKYTEKKVAAYSEDQLHRFFAACELGDRLAFRFMFFTGLREQELQFAVWPNLSFSARTYTVKELPEFGFTPKDKEERTIPLPEPFIAELKAWRAQNVGALLMFPAREGAPEGHFLRRLKKVALRAGLNCGHCKADEKDKDSPTCATEPICHHWELHKLRKSFATFHHRRGVPARTLQRWLGHSSLETTVAYIADVDNESETVRQQVNNSFAAFATA